MYALVLIVISLILCSCGRTEEIAGDSKSKSVEKKTVRTKTKATKAAEKKNIELVEAREFLYKIQPYSKIKAVFSDKAGLIDNGIITIVVSPPYEFCYWLNPENKAYLTRKLLVTKAQYSNVVKRKSTIITGYTCTIYDCYKNRKMKVGTFYSTKEIKLHPILNNLLCNTIGVPTGYGFPVKTVGITMDAQEFLTIPGAPKAKSATLLKLLKVQNIKVDPNIFRVPKGYKKAETPLGFAISESGVMNEKDVEDLFEHHFKKK